MAYQEKYSVSKRGQTSGPFTATEIIDLLRMKEISTIHKVKLGKDWISVSDFIDQYEKGLLPEQNLEKVFEEYTAEDKHETVRLVLINRFHVDENDIGLNMDSTISYHRMITYAMMEAALGYNRAHQLWIDANVTQYINDQSALI